MSDPTRWHDLLAAATATHAPAPWWVAAATAAAATTAVAHPRSWPLLRNVVTIAHEGGHAAVAAATGRQLGAIRLHSDTSGVTVSSGRPTGPGMVATAFAGYVAPSLLGLAAAALVGHGRSGLLLAVLVALLALMLVFVRNAWGLLTVTVTGAVLGATLYWAPHSWHAISGQILAWFFLLAGPRPVWELQVKRRAGEASESDADQLQRLTGLPGIVWVALFGAVCATCLGVGGWWMLR